MSVRIKEFTGLESLNRFLAQQKLGVQDVQVIVNRLQPLKKPRGKDTLEPDKIVTIFYLLYPYPGPRPAPASSTAT